MAVCGVGVVWGSGVLPSTTGEDWWGPRDRVVAAARAVNCRATLMIRGRQKDLRHTPEFQSVGLCDGTDKGGEEGEVILE